MPLPIVISVVDPGDLVAALFLVAEMIVARQWRPEAGKV